jgi:hypothetical protein
MGGVTRISEFTRMDIGQDNNICRVTGIGGVTRIRCFTRTGIGQDNNICGVTGMGAHVWGNKDNMFNKDGHGQDNNICGVTGMGGVTRIKCFTRTGIGQDDR